MIDVNKSNGLLNFQQKYLGRKINMRKIQKLSLSLLSLIAVSNWNTMTACEGDHMNIRVDGGESSEVSAAYSGNYHKIYAGTVKFTGNESGMTCLKIKGGKAQFNGPTDEMPQAIKFDVTPEGDVVDGDHVVVEVLTNGAAHDNLHNITLPTLHMQTDGYVIANSNTVVTISGLGCGSGALNLYSGDVTDPDYIGVTVPADLSTASNPINVYGETHFGASALSKLTTGQTTVKDGGLLEVVAATAGAAPGAVVVENGAILEVAGNTTIPAQGDAGDVFTGTLMFENNSTLWLRNNVVWDRDILGAGVAN